MGVTKENYELEEHVIWKGTDQDRSTTIHVVTMPTNNNQLQEVATT
jgi:hypothetical protein